MMYNNRFFRTREDAKEFQRVHGGAIYSYAPRSRTKRDFIAEMAVALDVRHEVANVHETPWCVAWNESRTE